MKFIGDISFIQDLKTLSKQSDLPMKINSLNSIVLPSHNLDLYNVLFKKFLKHSGSSKKKKIYNNSFNKKFYLFNIF